MRVRYATTFEFPEAQPETIRGELDAPSMPTAARRAAQAAQKAFPGRRWSSLVILLDRHGLPR